MPPDLLFYISTVFIFLVFAAFFSAAETAITSVSRARIHKLETEGHKRAKIVTELRKNQDGLLGTILLSNNLLGVGATALTTSLLISIFGEEGILYATMIMSVMIFVFTEVLPKTYAFQNAERTAMFIAPIIKPLVKLFAPINFAVSSLARLGIRLLMLNKKGTEIISPTDALRGAIDLHHAEGSVEKGDKEMLGSILDLVELEVSEIMVHRRNMLTFNIDDDPEKLVMEILANSHSRIPLWRDNPDNIIGVIHVKDLARYSNDLKGDYGKLDLMRIADEPWFIPENTTLRVQLHAFREKKKHLALVVDEYGALKGLLTLEDILEEIVGQIDDEHDVAGLKVRKIRDNSYLIDASISIRDLNRQLDWNLPDENAATLAGLVIYQAGNIPEAGQEVMFENFAFKVMRRSGNRILSILANENINAKSEQ